MGRTCLRTGVLHMGSHSNKKCLLKPWDTHLAFSLSNKGPQSFLLTPTRGFSLFHFYSFYKVPVPDCWSSLLFLPLINWVILGKVFLVSEMSPLVWKGGIDIRTVIIIIVLILGPACHWFSPRLPWRFLCLLFTVSSNFLIHSQTNQLMSRTVVEAPNIVCIIAALTELGL